MFAEKSIANSRSETWTLKLPERRYDLMSYYCVCWISKTVKSECTETVTCSMSATSVPELYMVIPM